MSRTVLVGAVVLVCCPVGAATGRAQDAPTSAADSASRARWFPGSFVVAPLLAAPREVKLGAGFVVAEREDEADFDGTNLEAQVAVGARVPVIRFQDEAPGRPAADLGIEVGVFSRFFMETAEKDLIDVDYRVGIPFSLRTGAWDLRLSLVHVSSHLGDDFVERFPQLVQQISREGFELLVGVRPRSALRLYVGGDLNLGRSESFEEAPAAGDLPPTIVTVERWAVRFGAEWDPTRYGPGTIGPFAAANFETTDFTKRLASSVVAGVAFRIGAVRLLLDAEFHDGPSPMGQFRTIDERLYGANIMLEL